MGPPRRPASAATPSSNHSATPIPYVPIYNANLKVIQRHTPGVVSYFDTFPHVCVFHRKINEDKSKGWTKEGWEGPCFLIERNFYPPYALYIMNRAGKEDFIFPIHPEDDFKMDKEHKGFGTYKSYPKYSAERLSQIPEGLDAFDSRYSIQSLLPIPEDVKGEDFAIGLWWQPTAMREGLDVVLQRLMHCSKLNQPYPQEHRFGPDRPPELNTIDRDATPVVARAPKSKSKKSKEQSISIKSNASTITNGKKVKKQANLAVEASGIAGTSAVDALFAGLSNSTQAALSNVPGTPSTGVPLLDSIFASAQTQPSSRPASAYSPPLSSSSSPFEHRPASAASQAFTSDVLNGLMRGKMPYPSIRRSSITSSSSASSYHRTGGTGRSQEGDDEESALSSYARSSGLSDSSTVLDSAPPSDIEDSSPMGNVSVPQDRTPRVNGHSRLLPPQSVPPVPVPPTMMSRERTLVPFSDESQLWPYTNLQTPPATTANGQHPEGEDEIPEFDFSDTQNLDSLVSSGVTPVGHDRRQSREQTITNGVNGHHHVNGYASSHSQSSFSSQHSQPQPQTTTSASRRNRRERREQNRQREREEIERTWEMPATQQSPLQRTTSSSASSGMLSAASQHIEALTPRVPAGGEPAPLDPAKARQAILDALHGRSLGADQGGAGLPPRLPKNDFVRELLTLIHTDRAYVDKLWNSYYGSST